MSDDKLGPTGDFPNGRLNLDDEGGLNMGIRTEGGCVRVDFAKEISWFAIGPDDALALASILVRHAMALKARRG